MNGRHIAASTVFAACALLGAAAGAQTIQLAPGFQPDPMRISGSAGGTVDAGTLQAGCLGQLSATPNHVITVTAPMPSFRLSVTSADDTTLVVRGPDGVRCNDDTNGVNPELSGALAAGTYEVFVGTYYGGNTPYNLELSAGGGAAQAVAIPPIQPTTPPVPTQSWPAVQPTSHQLAPGFAPDPMTAAGVVSPNVSLDTRSPSAWGWADQNPNHIVTLPTALPYLRMSVNSDQDTVLFVDGPGGPRFNDDTNGLNPEVSGAFQAGTYSVYVGRYVQDVANYTIAFTTAGGTPVATAAAISPGFTPDPLTFNGTSGGPVSASDLGVTPSGPCRGQIATAPNHTFTANAPFNYLRVYVSASTDTTIVVEGPNGRMCNDDSDGFNPAIAGPFPAGTYNVWVGAYSATGAYTLNVSEFSP